MNDEKIHLMLLCHFKHAIFVLNADFLIKTDFLMKKRVFFIFIF